MQARPADAEGQGRSDALGERGADAADAEAQAGQVLAHPWSRWSSPARGQEEEAGALLVRVTEESTMGIGGRALLQAVHPSHASQPIRSMFH